MKVDLVSYTPRALALLLYTKNTRLRSEQTLDDIESWSDETKKRHLAYMRGTIQSSWEFVDYTFRIVGVSRVLTHQLVRTRTASFAQEAQRAVDISDSEFVGPHEHGAFRVAVHQAQDAYTEMLVEGVPRQDARYVMPEGTQTAIMVKANLRTLHDMALLRLCFRAQGEYQQVFRAMVDEVVDVHPWADDFLRVHCAWYGRCAFPDYDECPVSEEIPELRSDSMARLAHEKWKASEHEANPVAVNGRTMGAEENV